MKSHCKCGLGVCRSHRDVYGAVADLAGDPRPWKMDVNGFVSVLWLTWRPRATPSALRSARQSLERSSRQL